MNVVRDVNEFNNVQSGVYRKHCYFDLEKFMNKGYNVDVGVVLITPLQMVMTDCYKRNDYVGFYTHEDTMKEIYGAVYNGNNVILDKEWDSVWPFDVIRDGNICMQMCNGISKDNSNDIIISMPDVVSEEQYNALVYFNDYIKKIYENNKSSFDIRPMLFKMIASNSKFSDIECRNNIDFILEKIKSRVGEVNYRDEFIVGTDFGSSLNESKGMKR